MHITPAAEVLARSRSRRMRDQYVLKSSRDRLEASYGLLRSPLFRTHELSNTGAAQAFGTQDWAKRCYVEAIRSTDEPTKAFLIELAQEFQEFVGGPLNLDPDDGDLQDAAADRLLRLAAIRGFWRSA